MYLVTCSDAILSSFKYFWFFIEFISREIINVVDQDLHLAAKLVMLEMMPHMAIEEVVVVTE